MFKRLLPSLRIAEKKEDLKIPKGDIRSSEAKENNITNNRKTIMTNNGPQNKNPNDNRD